MNRRLTGHDLRSPWNFLALGFGSGLAPFAPGTFGTLAAVPLYLLLSLFSADIYLLLVILMALVGIPICDRAARNLGVHDHPGIVWDEFVGLLLTLTLAPAGWFWLLYGFVLFRLFDIVKPWPIRTIDQKVGGGLGIMLDDIYAAFYAWLCLQGTYLFIG